MAFAKSLIHSSGKLSMQTLKCTQCNLINFATAKIYKRCNALLEETKDLDLKLNWFYSHKGKRIGPINESFLKQLIGDGIISDKTLVWQNGMSDWTTAHQTNLASLFATTRNEPPPLIGEVVDNNIVWVIALVPFISGILRVLISILLGIPAYKFWWIAIILNISLCIADENRLKNAGYDTKGMGIWAFLLVPVYLFIRASRLKQDNSYAIVWLVTFFISVFIL